MDNILTTLITEQAQQLTRGMQDLIERKHELDRSIERQHGAILAMQQLRERLDAIARATQEDSNA